MVAALIFDLDGVLVDSEPIWEEVRRAYVDRHGGRWRDDAQRRLMGMSTGEWSRYLSDDLGVGRDPERIATEVIEEVAGRYREHLPLIPGAPETVRRLADHWPLGLASSSAARLIKVTLEAAGLAGLFQVTLSTEQVQRGKPAPDVYLAVAQRLGVPAADCVAVEDSSNGVRSAAGARMRVIAVPHGAYPLDPDAREHAALILGSIGELDEAAVRALG